MTNPLPDLFTRAHAVAGDALIPRPELEMFGTEAIDNMLADLNEPGLAAYFYNVSAIIVSCIAWLESKWWNVHFVSTDEEGPGRFVMALRATPTLQSFIENHDGTPASRLAALLHLVIRVGGKGKRE